MSLRTVSGLPKAGTVVTVGGEPYPKHTAGDTGRTVCGLYFNRSRQGPNWHVVAGKADCPDCLAGKRVIP